MLRPQEMSSVIITGPKSVQEDIVKELHDMRILHIVEHSKNELADIGRPMENAARLSEILVRIRALMSSLEIEKEEAKFELKRGMPEIEATTKKLSDEASLSMEELKKLDEQLSRSQAIRQELEVLKGISLPLENFTAYKTLSFFSGYLHSKEYATILKNELSSLTSRFMLFESDAGKKRFIVLFVEAKNKEHANSILQKTGFSPVNFAGISGLNGDAASNLERINSEIAKLQHRREAIRKKQEKLGEDYKGFLVAADEFLEEQLEKAEAPLKFASTSTSFLIKGWIPTENLSKTIERLNKAAKNKIYVNFEPAKKQEKVPVKLKNPRIAKPFEFFMDLYSLPAYKEIDPTFFIFLAFPIFFGIMLGDIGYGLVSFIVFWMLKKKMPKARNFFNVLLLASFVSIIFGILFGEFFGLEKIGNFQLWHMLSRTHDMFTLMYIVIGIGIVHVNIGLVVGFINELKSHGLMQAVYSKGAWFALEIGLLLLIYYYLKSAISLLYLVMGVISLLLLVGYMLYKGEGIKGLIEIPSIFTHILSYLRLMAIGLSSVILAVIINDSSKEFFHKGGIFIFVGALILVVGHIMNILLGLLGSFLQSLRLHYVEFFSKFYHGGAEKYKPFGSKE